jgi:hypothetical protein
MARPRERRDSISPELAAYVDKVRARILIERQHWRILPLPPRFGDGNALFAAGVAAAQLGDALATTARTLLDSLAAAEGETA